MLDLRVDVRRWSTLAILAIVTVGAACGNSETSSSRDSADSVDESLKACLASAGAVEASTSSDAENFVRREAGGQLSNPGVYYTGRFVIDAFEPVLVDGRPEGDDFLIYVFRPSTSTKRSPVAALEQDSSMVYVIRQPSDEQFRRADRCLEDA